MLSTNERKPTGLSIETIANCRQRTYIKGNTDKRNLNKKKTKGKQHTK